MRKYQPVWEQIKLTGKCEISSHKAYHWRIRKAVWKEKDLDLLYKLQCSEANPPIKAFTKVTTLGSVIIFELEIRNAITVDTV